MTQISKSLIESALKTGLSAKASAVYVVLLESGVSISPKSIIIKTKLHRQYVYDALRELEERRLIITIGEGRKVRYSATNPDRLAQDAEKQRLDALEGVRNLMKLYDRSPAGVIEIIRGWNEVIEDEFQMLHEANKGDFLDIVGGAGMQWVKLFKERISEWETLREEKQIKLRYIGSGEDVEHNRSSSIIKNESRIIPDIGNIVNVVIRPESVSFNIYEPEILTVRVRNDSAVVSQRALFEVLWRVAK